MSKAGMVVLSACGRSSYICESFMLCTPFKLSSMDSELLLVSVRMGCSLLRRAWTERTVLHGIAGEVVRIVSGDSRKRIPQDKGNLPLGSKKLLVGRQFLSLSWLR